ncbi:MFS transporter [Actinoallomurus iriomotensis]|uniref:MFS transporter n=1 Tax=Actinoallomurus iriomotensis TaxID=478107 RepID=A0A9W6SE10_9ACTN|nr:MFS transporter [Actinoallomurus iriomotensis]GLY90955.1 MFS transporter [Actinoallomurus iriomotensis]
MSTNTSAWTRWSALAALTGCVFTVGTAEYVMVGLLPTLSAGLRVPVPTAGLLVSWYALTVAVGGPLVTALTLRLPRKALLLALLVVFAGANAVAAVATGFGMLVAARMVTALTHSTSFAVAIVLAVGMVPPARRGQAIAVVAAGGNLATVLGAPLGTWLGQTYGWRTTFWAIVALSALMFAAVAALTARPAEEASGPSRAELATLRQRRVVTLLGIIVVSQAGLFAFYTYLSPFLGLRGFSPRTVTLLLAILGAGALAGNFTGGRLADRAPWGSLSATILALAGALAALALAGRLRATTVVTVLVLGVVMGALIPLLQERALAAAPTAPTLITATSASAFNLGIAGGSWLGGHALDAGLDLAYLPWTGIPAVLAALPLTVYAARAHRSDPRPADHLVRVN